MCGAEPVSINIVYEQLRAGRGGGGAAPGRPGRWSKQNQEPLSPAPRAGSAVRLTRTLCAEPCGRFTPSPQTRQPRAPREHTRVGALVGRAHPPLLLPRVGAAHGNGTVTTGDTSSSSARPGPSHPGGSPAGRTRRAESGERRPPLRPAAPRASALPAFDPCGPAGRAADRPGRAGGLLRDLSPPPRHRAEHSVLAKHSPSAPRPRGRNQGGVRGAGGTHPGRSRRVSSWLGGHASAQTPGRRVTSCWKKLLQKLLRPRALGSPLPLQPIRAREQIITNRCPANEAPSPHNGPQAETMSPACRWRERGPQPRASD